MVFTLYYIVAITLLILHFTGHLEQWGVDWLIFALAITVFPVVLYF
jgi:hypothetical protein